MKPTIDRFARRRGRRSKMRDHRRFGRCGWVGGNPRYSRDDRRHDRRPGRNRRVDRRNFGIVADSD